MRVKVNSWNGKRTMDLEDALTPEPSWGDSGSVEQARELAQEACKTIGRLVANLVERDLMSLEDANKITGGNIIGPVDTEED